MPAAAVNDDEAVSEPHSLRCRHLYMQTRTNDSKALEMLSRKRRVTLAHSRRRWLTLGATLPSRAHSRRHPPRWYTLDLEALLPARPCLVVNGADGRLTLVRFACGWFMVTFGVTTLLANACSWFARPQLKKLYGGSLAGVKPRERRLDRACWKAAAVGKTIDRYVDPVSFDGKILHSGFVGTCTQARPHLGQDIVVDGADVVLAPGAVAA